MYLSIVTHVYKEVEIQIALLLAYYKTARFCSLMRDEIFYSCKDLWLTYVNQFS